ncbi:MAG: metallophosphoesterase family protein [Candidatus Latescibacterota bacterium]|nr:metallophosphoesterase family protein [Candidatus Latescibacterota bacterium]
MTEEQRRRSWTIGVIADTHGLLDDGIPALYAEVDLILHAGDVGPPSILNHLSHIAPTLAVRGNVDEDTPLSHLPLSLSAVFNSVCLYVTHAFAPPGKRDADCAPEDADIVIFGHSHQQHLQTHDDNAGRPVLYFNPASAGPKRFRNPRSTGILEIDESGHFQARHLLLD